MRRISNEIEIFVLIKKLIFFLNFFFFTKPGEPVAQSSPIQNSYGGYHNGNGNYNPNDANSPNTDPEMNDGLERSRSRKKRDFFGTLKRRLGRSKSRAKSLERSGAVPIDAEHPAGKSKFFIFFRFLFCFVARKSSIEKHFLFIFFCVSIRSFLLVML